MPIGELAMYYALKKQQHILQYNCMDNIKAKKRLKNRSTRPNLYR